LGDDLRHLWFSDPFEINEWNAETMKVKRKSLHCLIIFWVIWVATLSQGVAGEDDKGVLGIQPALPPPILQPAPSRTTLSIIEENPTMSYDGGDRHYTNGAMIELTTGPLEENSLFNAPIRWLRGSLFNATTDADDRLEWQILGQDIFTAQDHTHKDTSLSDRPFAGWLYGGLNFIQNDHDKELTSLTVQAGVVGSYSLGRQVQNTFHDILNIGRVHGWGHQLSNEPGVVISWDKRWRFNHDLGNQYSWELIPDVGVTVGNIYDYANFGTLFRWGKGLLANWGPNMVLPSYSGTSYFAPEKVQTLFGYDFYLGVQGRAVALNLFLDGNTFQDSRSVAKEPVVGDVYGGLEFFYKDAIRVGFTLMLRSPEFTRQRGPDTFGGFNVTFNL
jgi:lipid A 3-O-deacylase